MQVECVSRVCVDSRGQDVCQHRGLNSELAVIPLSVNGPPASNIHTNHWPTNKPTESSNISPNITCSLSPDHHTASWHLANLGRFKRSRWKHCSFHVMTDRMIWVYISFCHNKTPRTTRDWAVRQALCKPDMGHCLIAAGWSICIKGLGWTKIKQPPVQFKGPICWIKTSHILLFTAVCRMWYAQKLEDKKSTYRSANVQLLDLQDWKHPISMTETYKHILLTVICHLITQLLMGQLFITLNSCWSSAILFLQKARNEKWG